MIVDAWSALLSVVLAIFLTVTLSFIVVLRRPTVYRPIAVAFVAFQVDLILWTIGYLLSYSSRDPGEKEPWFLIYFAVANFCGFTWLVLALACTDRAPLLTKRNLALLAMPGAAMAGAILTNGWHHLFFSWIEQSQAIGDLNFSSGPLYWIGAGHSYVYIVLGAYLHGRFALASSDRFRWLGLAAVASTIPPFAVNALAVLRFTGVSFGMTQVAALTSSLAFILVIAAFNLRLGNTVRLAIDQAVEQMGEGILITDVDDRILNTNQAFEAIFHLQRSDIIGRHVGEVIARIRDQIVNVDRLTAEMRPALSDQWGQLSTDVMVKGNPSQIYNFQIWPIRDKNGAFAGRVGTLSNVTDMHMATDRLAQMASELQVAHDEMEKRVKERTAALAKSERRFRMLAENVREVFWVHIVDGEGMPYVSPMYEEMFGRGCESIYAQPMSWMEVVHPDDRQRVIVHMLRMIQGDDAEPELEFRLVRPDGKTGWVRSRVFPFRDDEGGVSGLTGVTEDITEQKLAHMEREQLVTEMERERTTLTALMGSMSDGLLVLDTDYRVRYCNSRAGELLSIDPAIATGRSLGVVFADVTLSRENRAIRVSDWERLLGSPQEHTSFEIATSGPNPRELTVDRFRVVDANGSELGIGMLLSDVTGERMLALLKERERIAMDLHDGVIQSLYAVALGLAAQERMLDGEATTTRDGLREARTQISGVIQEIRNYIFDLRLQKLGERGVRAGLEALAEELRVNALITPELEIGPEVDDLLGSGETGSLLHIVREATSNIIRHAGASRVKISLARRDGRLVLKVRDNGRGFDPGSVRQRSNGSGNGLRNMAERARGLGGSLETESVPERGTEIRLVLPLSEGALQEGVAN